MRELTPRSNAVHEARVPYHIRGLRNFLGERLDRSQASLTAELSHYGKLYECWARERNPWLFGLRAYDQLTRNGAHLPTRWPRTLQKLASDGLMIWSLSRGMDEKTRSKYQIDLQTDQHSDFIHEIRTAWHYHVLGYDIKWYVPNTKGPEFSVLGGGLDFDIECRRFQTDISETIKSQHVATLCDCLGSELARLNFWGDVRLEISSEFKFNAAKCGGWLHTLESESGAGRASFELSDAGVGVVLEGDFGESAPFTVDQMNELSRPGAEAEFIALQARRENGLGFNPIVFRCRGPRRTPNELRDIIYTTLKKKVKTQLSADRPGLLVVKMDGVTDPQVFNESDGMRDVVNHLFKNDHLVAIVFRCQNIENNYGNEVHDFGEAMIFKNPSTKFIEVANAIHLS